jgi:transposase InsO family protein
MTKREPAGKLLRWVLFLQSMQFEVKHRAGKKHQNADALSRSICVIEEIETNEIYSIDPTEDQVLIEFLKNNRFDLGISNQKKKQILKIADKYKYENEILYFIKNDEFRIIPKIDQRYMLVEKSHILGHRSIADMYDILKKSFHWPKMFNQIEQYFKKCHVCCKHAKIRQNNHPALAFEQVNLAFDKIGIDLVFGLNQTAQGFKGLCVIYCYLSKYPFVRAIKSKEAPVIARVLFEFITLFGAPRELVSDQGTEFLNNVVKELTKIEYIDHLITSSYNPRCNGSVERYNQTFINTLTRLSDENPRNWPDYIQLACMAYRTRQQSSTKFTPHELVFGKHHNDLIDYHQDMNANEELTLNLRLQQIGTQFKDFISKAKLNIDIAHNRQQHVQDSRSKIVEKLTKGSIVYIQTPELCRKKLEERFIGPYTVHAQSRRDNYWLLNEHNELLKHSYPINKLKISQRIEEEEFIMESIKEMRKIKGFLIITAAWQIKNI